MSITKPLVVVALLGLSSLAPPACDSTLEVANSTPRATWVAVAPPVDGVADITVWISDLEGDPVTLILKHRTAGDTSEGTDIKLAAGGHGLSGLTTHLGMFDPNGQPHLIKWDATGLTGQVQLRFSPEDNDDKGEVSLSPTFDIAVGLPDAEAVVGE